MSDRLNVPLIQVVTLALWLGGAAFFAASVAPAAFAILPTRTLAGAVVGRLLPSVFYSGMLVAAAVILLDVLVRHARFTDYTSLTAGVTFIACAVAQLLVAPRIERLRAQLTVPLDSLAVDDPIRVSFGRLHGASVAWMGLAMIAAFISLIIAGRSLQSRS